MSGDSVDALENRLKHLEEELISTQTIYFDEKRRRADRRVIPKTRAQVEEEMKAQRQKALFGDLYHLSLKAAPPPQPAPVPARLPPLQPEPTSSSGAAPSAAGSPPAQTATTAEPPAQQQQTEPEPEPEPAEEPLPLAPRFYNEAHEREFDRQIMDFECEESKLEYSSLEERFREYLNGDEETLYELWKRLGGVHGWRKHIRPTQLALLLSRETIVKVRYRMKMDKLTYLDGFIIEDREASSFISNLISRLPKLEYLEVVDCPIRPFDLRELQHVRNPFQSLKGIYAVAVKWTAEDVLQLVKKFCKNLEPNKMRVDPKTLTFTAAVTQKNIVSLSGGKVSFA